MSEGVDSKKLEFKNYLQKTGAVDQLTKVLVQLYEQSDKPESSIEYVRKFLGAQGDLDGQRLQKQYDTVLKQNERLKKQVEEIKQELQKKKQK